MSFFPKTTLPPKVKITVPDANGTTVAQEVELNIQSREDLERVVSSLTNLLEWQGKITPQPTRAQLIPSASETPVDAIVANIAPPRQQLVRTAFQLMHLRKLSVSHVPGFEREANVYPALLALYTMEHVERRITIAKLAKAIAVPTTTLLRLIDRMEAGDLIRRRPVPEDGRAVMVELTERSRSMLDTFFQAAGETLMRQSDQQP